MNVFVTGANGFVAKRLIARLIDGGHSVVGYDVRPAPTTPAYDLVVGDLSKGEGLDTVDFGNVDAVVHLAAAGVTTPTRTWPLCSAVNVVGTQRLLYAMDAAEKTPLLIHTRSFYENHLDDASGSFVDNPYVVTKHLAHELVRAWAERSTQRRVVVGTVYQAYGPGNEDASVLTYAATCIRQREHARFGSGKGLRDWIFVDDVADALATAVTMAEDPSWSGVRDYDFGSGSLTSLKEAITLMARLADLPEGLLAFDPELDRNDTNLRDAATKTLPNWRPAVDLRSGLETLLKSVDLADGGHPT